jgi:hypothetical protein
MLGSNPDPPLVAEQNNAKPNAPEGGEVVIGVKLSPCFPNMIFG